MRIVEDRYPDVDIKRCAYGGCASDAFAVHQLAHALRSDRFIACGQQGEAAAQGRSGLLLDAWRAGRRAALNQLGHSLTQGLAVQPQLIVCDEPTLALDVSVQGQILNLLRELQRELGVSYLFITHNIGVVEYIADRMVVMKAGRVEEQGPSDTVLCSPTHAYTRTLLAAVPRLQAAV